MKADASLHRIKRSFCFRKNRKTVCLRATIFDIQVNGKYIKLSEDKSKALLDVSEQFGHSDIRITRKYACIQREKRYLREN